MQAASCLGQNEAADGRMKCRAEMSPTDDSAQEACRHCLIDFVKDLQEGGEGKALLRGHLRRGSGVCFFLRFCISPHACRNGCALVRSQESSEKLTKGRAQHHGLAFTTHLGGTLLENALQQAIDVIQRQSGSG